MNLLVHMSGVVVLDYIIFRYWYTFANRFIVLNYEEVGFLPARYIISSIVAGAFIYWLYLITVSLMCRFSRKYQHPEPGTLWLAAAIISAIQVVITVRSASHPPLTLPVTAALVIHLEIIHLLMFMTGSRLKKDPLRLIMPGVAAGVLFMIDWLFWLWYSFEVLPSVTPRPTIGSPTERGIMISLLSVLITLGILYMSGLEIPFVRRDARLIPELPITLSDVMRGFYSAWALFYLIIPVGHYLLRGYVTDHSNLFPAFISGFFVPLAWSLVGAVLLVWLMHPGMVLRLSRLRFLER